MIKSMTGFGQSQHDDGQLQINVEVKSLNSKFLDLGLRLPKTFSEKELEVRNAISEKLERGKISIAIEYQRYGQQEIKQTYNEALFLAYYAQLKRLADKAMAPYENLFEAALNSPEVIQSKQEEFAEEDWDRVKKLVLQAIAQCDEFRRAEGKSLESKLTEYIQSIGGALKKVEELDPKRVERIR